LEEAGLDPIARKRALEAMKSEMSPSGMLGSGRYGFQEFSQQIQNSLLQKQDPLSIERNKALAEINRQLGLLVAKDPPAPAGGLAPGMGGNMFNGIPPGGGMGMF